MRTSIGLFAFASFLLAVTGSASAQEVVWMRSYQEARDHGQKVKKPLAIVVGTGSTGFQQLVQDGVFSGEVRKILASEYVPVYLDADKAENQRLIDALGITKRKGMVLGDRTGETQAFFHDGSLSQAELGRQLSYFANPSIVVRTTATTGSGRISYYPSQYTAPATSSRNC